jgi:glycosyltransferase involved in cell wall biosynthesis
VRVLVFHGYLLHGTGSNVYNASLVRALARMGHEVHLLCQDRNPPEFPGPGSVTVHNPDIGGLLPVYVHDTYAGFEVKEFPELSDDELERYIALNAEAVEQVIADHGAPDAVLANHLVMGPVALARAGLRYALKVHGSDLSYTVLPHLERFKPYAEEALAAANGVLVGSAHIADRLREAVDTPEVNAKVRLGPPGVDTTLFAPVASTEARRRLHDLASTLNQAEYLGGADAWSRDLGEVAGAVEWFAESRGPRVVFVGKTIVNKGADLLLAAWPLVHESQTDARLLIAGFGSDRGWLEALWRSLSAGDPVDAKAVADDLPIITRFLAAPPPGYAQAAQAAAGSIRFSGRLTHDEVGELVPAADALVFPSTFPEAFGMVAAEAAAAGVLPVSAAHSGALEVSHELAAGLPPDIAPLVSFPVDDEAITAIAGRLNAWLATEPDVREEARQALRETAIRLWSWEGVARAVLAASAGELDKISEAT